MKNKSNNEIKEKITRKSNLKNTFCTFIGYVKNLDTNAIQEIKIKINKPVEDLTYDEVEIAIVNEFDKRNSPTDILRNELHKITILDQKNPKIQWPVFREDDPEIGIQVKMSNCKKILILPNATYSLTPECELWMKLKDEGIVSENEKFNFDQMHRLLKDIEKDINHEKTKIVA